MIVRDYKTEDEQRMREIFALQSFEYKFPEFERMMLCRVVTDGDRPIMAAALKPTAEAFLLLDPQWQTPGLRMAALRALHEDIRKQLVDFVYGRASELPEIVRKQLSPLELPEIHAWPPPEFEHSFGRRLVRNFGWELAPWTCYFKKVI